MIIKNKAYLLEEAPSVSVSIAPAGNEPLAQSYDEATGDYVPDRELLPLILVPTVIVDGKDVSAEEPESKKWYRILADGSMSQITDASTAVELYPQGYHLGLKIERNSRPSDPLKYLFEVTVKGVKVMEEITLRAIPVAAPTPDFELDFPSSSLWNPFDTDRDKVTITPVIHDYGQTGLSLEWERQEGTTRRAIDLTDPQDAELDIDAVTGTITIDRRWMGEKITLWSVLSKDGKKLREKPVVIRRRIPDYTAEVLSPEAYSGNDSNLLAQAYVRYSSGQQIPDPSKELRIGWFDCSGASPTEVGTGNEHLYPIKGDDVGIGMEITDKGPMKLLTTTDGKYLMYDGKLIGGRIEN